MGEVSDAIGDVTTIPYLQELNKAGLMSLLMTGTQITASIIVVNEMYSEQTYEASRFFANFIYFVVPRWEKDKQQEKYIISTPVNEALANTHRRLEE